VRQAGEASSEKHLRKEIVMDSKPTSERQVDTAAQIFLHSEKRQGARPGEAQAFTIAISRDSGSNGHLIARAVGARLNWPVYDQELLRKVADDMGLRAHMLESLDEKRANWLQESLAGFVTSAPTADSSAYVHHLVETLFSLAANGECVILGRGAAQLLPPATTLRVRLVGPLEDRIATMQQRLGVRREEAARRIAQTDYDRSRFVVDNFNKNPADPCRYDLVLNSARLGVETCADVIVETLRRVQERSAAKGPARAAS
jgi:cytidylate kinase